MTDSAPQPPKINSTHRIATNTFWLGVELVIGVAGAIVTSIMLARSVGPESMGHYSFVLWLVSLSSLLGGVGLPITTRRYMADALASDKPGHARAIFSRHFRRALVNASLLGAAAVAAAFWYATPNYRPMSILLAASTLPRLLALIPANANLAREDAVANLPGSLLNGLTTIAATFLSLSAGWGLPGVAAGVLGGYVLESAVNLRAAWSWIRRLPYDSLPAQKISEMNRFSREGWALAFLNVFVWGRSDVFFLRFLQNDARQIAFFSLSFTLVERLSSLSQVFSRSISLNQFAMPASQNERQRRLVPVAVRYLALVSIPPLLGLAALSGPAVRAVYGSQYLAMIPVAATACVFGLSRSLMPPLINFLRVSNQQRYLIAFSVAGGLAGILIDFLLIPRHGALGAAIGNGLGQLATFAAMWLYAVRKCSVPLKFGSLLPVFLSATAMAGAAYGAASILSPAVAIPTGILLGAASYFVALRLLGAVDEDDLARLRNVANLMPRASRGPVLWLFSLLVPPRNPVAEPRA